MSDLVGNHIVGFPQGGSYYSRLIPRKGYLDIPKSLLTEIINLKITNNTKHYGCYLSIMIKSDFCNLQKHRHRSATEYMLILLHRQCNSTTSKIENLSRITRKATMWFLNRSDTNPLVQSQKMARRLKFGLRKKRNCSICVVKIKALISFAVTIKLIWVFVFTYADC